MMVEGRARLEEIKLRHLSILVAETVAPHVKRGKPPTWYFDNWTGKKQSMDRSQRSASVRKMKEKAAIALEARSQREENLRRQEEREKRGKAQQT